MKIVNDYPPNITEIRQVLNPPPNAIFAYDHVIYNPSDEKIWPDLEEHEKVHFTQQDKLGSADLWWKRYLLDPDFRLDQELEAYNVQYLYIKSKMPNNKAVKALLTEMASQIATIYGIKLGLAEAESKIRNYGR